MVKDDPSAVAMACLSATAAEATDPNPKRGVSTPPPAGRTAVQAQAAPDKPPQRLARRRRLPSPLPCQPENSAPAVPPEPSALAAQAEVAPPPPATPEAQREALAALVTRAEKGDVAALAEIRALLDDRADVWKTMGDLGRHAIESVVTLAASGNPLVAESVRRFLARRMEEFAGPDPSPLVRHLAEVAALTWGAYECAERDAALPTGSSIGHGMYRIRRAEAAIKRHLAAVKTLVVVQGLVETKGQRGRQRP